MMFQDWFNTASAKIPADPVLREDYQTPVLKTAANGNVRVVVPEFEGGDGEVSHCDEFMAGVLARSAADAGGAAWADPGDDEGGANFDDDNFGPRFAHHSRRF